MIILLFSESIFHQCISVMKDIFMAFKMTSFFIVNAICEIDENLTDSIIKIAEFAE